MTAEQIIDHIKKDMQLFFKFAIVAYLDHDTKKNTRGQLESAYTLLNELGALGVYDECFTTEFLKACRGDRKLYCAVLNYAGMEKKAA